MVELHLLVLSSFNHEMVSVGMCNFVAGLDTFAFREMVYYTRALVAYCM